MPSPNKKVTPRLIGVTPRFITAKRIATLSSFNGNRRRDFCLGGNRFHWGFVVALFRTNDRGCDNLLSAQQLSLCEELGFGTTKERIRQSSQLSPRHAVIEVPCCRLSCGGIELSRADEADEFLQFFVLGVLINGDNRVVRARVRIVLAMIEANRGVCVAKRLFWRNGEKSTLSAATLSTAKSTLLSTCSAAADGLILSTLSTSLSTAESTAPLTTAAKTTTDALWSDLDTNKCVRQLHGQGLIRGVPN